MDLKQLEAFVYVAKLNSFSKAADTIYLSQPTISSHINALEKELGTQLLIRSTKEVYPTKSGLDFFVYAQNMLALRDEAIHSVAQGGCSIKGEISLLASSVPAQYLLPSLIAAFQKSYPDILFKVRQSDSEQVGKLLSNCIYDFGITGTKLSGNKFVQVPFYHDTLVLAVPACYSTPQNLSPETLKKLLRTQPFIMREDGSGTKKELENFLLHLNLTLEHLNTVCCFNNTHGVLQAVSSGAGISFVSRASTAMYTQMGLIKTIELNDFVFKRNFYLLSKKEMILQPVQKLFQTYLLNYYKELQ
ncbi:LysR family transcriptional regulator [Lacrimispora amygdalina]|uniref:LysR family transcriptional regulator n=1 Tax=Lacrimispora amygdalina TaxID=253257 RepID=A0A3E2NFF5_9FIRM|nr:selenium metabolism-associated LysR family transcriptional regulator [Clostridium indicum]RFZ79715.1 LysR family transcriptional regulator [Clostridium indicum]